MLSPMTSGCIDPIEKRTSYSVGNLFLFCFRVIPTKVGIDMVLWGVWFYACS